VDGRAIFIHNRSDGDKWLYQTHHKHLLNGLFGSAAIDQTVPDFIDRKFPGFIARSFFGSKVNIITIRYPKPASNM